MGDITAHFSHREMECQCCGKSTMHLQSVQRLQRLRWAYAKPIQIVSGYRCAAYNDEIGATQTHASRQAFDIGIPREDLHEVVKLAFAVGFTGVGVKNRKGKWQLHIDDLPEIDGRPRPWLWTYP